MPPDYIHRSRFTETVDLTGDSDEDDARVTRPSGIAHPALNPTRKSGQSYARPPSSTAQLKGTSATQPKGRPVTDDLSPRRNTDKRSSGNVRPVSETNSKTQLNHAFRPSQSPHSHKSEDKNKRTPSFASARQEGSRKSNIEPIIITHDVEEDPQPVPRFKQPRGVEMQNLQQPNVPDPTRESVFSISKGQAKRQRDDDGQKGSPVPSKRPRLTANVNDRHASPLSDGVSKDNSEAVLRSKHGINRDKLSQNPSALNTNGGTSFDARSSPTKRKESRPFDQRIERNEARGPSQNFSTRPRKGPLTSDLFEDEQGSVSKQRESAGIDPEDIRKLSNTRNNASNDDDDDDAHSSSVSGGQSSRRDTTPRIRKETAKAQALSAEKKSKSQSAGETHSPSNQEQASGARSMDRPKSNRVPNGGIEIETSTKSVTQFERGRSPKSATQRANESRQIQSGKKASKKEEPKSQPLPSRAVQKAKDVSGTPKTSNNAGIKGPNIPSASGSGVQAEEQDPNAEDLDPATALKPVSSEPNPSLLSTRLSDKATSIETKISEPGKRSRLVDDAAQKAQASTDDTVLKATITLAEEADLQLRSEAMNSDDQVNITSDLRNSFAMPTLAASAMRPPFSYSSELPLAAQVEKVLGKYLEELGDDNEYWTSVSMHRARIAKEQNQSPNVVTESAPRSGQHDPPTSFANLKSIEMLPHQKGSPSAKSDQLWGIERISSTGKGGGPTWVSAKYTTFTSDVPDVPSYAHYVSIKNNILAPNVTKLICWPYFGDEYDMSSLSNLREQYHLDIDDRERKLGLLLKAQKYESYVESALADLEISWADVLRFLLEPHPDIGNSADAMKALSNRHEFCEHDFSRISERWQSILSELPASKPEKLARAAVLCDNFQKLAKFSLWHVAHRSEFARLPDAEADNERNPQTSDNELTCTICLRFNCPYHGELKERPDNESDDDSESVADSVVATDIVHPPRVNYRSRVAIPPPYNTTEHTNVTAATRADKKDPKYWRKDEFVHLPDERGPFYPCHHPGTSCADAQCSCFENKLPCEKICSCAPDCPRKFQGCSCSTSRYKKHNRGPCFEDERCTCYQLGRECDPDLCGDCGACEVVDALNKHNESILNGRCRNSSILRGVPKHTMLGDSGVHGLGLYACENIQEHDFVGEYKGEIITKEEAERRGAVYEIQKLSYLFSLNATQEIDSTNFGNKVRFINHAKGKANLYPRIIMVNNVHRIALYASCTIRPGQELFFDYGPKFPDDQLGGKKSKKSAPHVRNAELVRNFLEVESSEDEAGNLRAKGVTHARNARNKTKSKKPRGGARPNAGRKPRVQRSIDETESTGTFNEHDAGERLAAFNISDDLSEGMDVDVKPGVDEDGEYEQNDGSESEESYESDDSGKSGFDAVEEDNEDFEDEGPGLGVTRPGRGAGAAKRRVR